jgi:hypothetical protein
VAADRNPCKENLDAYVKKIVSSLPPLTGKQRDLLAMISRSRHRKKLARHSHRTPRPAVGGCWLSGNDPGAICRIR